MFKEDASLLAAAERVSSIPDKTKVDADITDIKLQEPSGTRSGSFVVEVTGASGEYEGIAFPPFYITLAKTSGGARMRQRFYSTIGYVPNEGDVDETEFMGRPIQVTIANYAGKAEVKNWEKSPRLADEDGSSDEGAF